MTQREPLVRLNERGDGMEDYRAVTPASKPPALPLSTQMCVAAEMANPEIRGLAEMIGTEWQAEALRLEGAVDALEQAHDAIHRLCLERGSTDGYVAVLEAIDAHLPGGGSDG